MPAVSCPNCNTTLKAPDSAVGRTVKCPRCKEPFTVGAGQPEASYQSAAPQQYAAPPAHGAPHDDDRPRPRRRREHQAAPTGLQMGLGIASLAVGAIALPFALIPVLGAFSWPLAGVGLVLGIVGVIIACTRGAGIAFPVSGAAVSAVALMVAVVWILLIQRTYESERAQAAEIMKGNREAIRKATEQAFENFDKKAPDFGNPFDKDKGGFKDKGGPPGAPPAVLQLAFNGGVAQAESNLTMMDGRHPKHNWRCKVFLVPMVAGKQYQIDMTTKEFDAYQFLHNPNDQYITHNDDTPEGLNSRIIHACTQTGIYRVHTASCGDTGQGRFTLRVQEK